ncbi:MAG TPA: hydrogenase maturation protease [Acidimicrobiales bacterium]|nr:hydrogenase maturation protease [Acidimicrobiales bacterium]
MSDTASSSEPGRMAGDARRVVVAGLGSEYRRDDGAGSAAVAMVVQQCPGVTVVGPLDDPLDLLGLWDGAALAVVVDAVSSGSPPGTVQVVELDPVAARPTREQGASGTKSTHGIGLAGVYRLARAIERAPSRVVVVGIEGSDFGQGVGLTEEVEAGVEHAAYHVVEMIREVSRCV